MLSLIFYVLAAILFAVAGVNETLLDQPPADLVAFGLLSVALGLIFAGLPTGVFRR